MENITLRANIILGDNVKANRGVERKLRYITAVLKVIDKDGIMAVLDLWADTTDGDEQIVGNVTCDNYHFKGLIQGSIAAYVKFST